MNDRSDIAIEFLHTAYRVSPDRVLLHDLNLSIIRGETLMLLGRSGSGKTTTLKLINRLLVPSEGEVRVEDRSTVEWNVIQLRRHIGYAIQDVGLFPHYTVEQNVSLIPRLENWDVTKLSSRVKEVLDLVGLPHSQYAERYPDQLSGGQRQRVGLARALAADPPILLMDEPFGALDPITRTEIQKEFQALQKRLHKTVVFVTHDIGEALMLGTRIVLMDSGTVRGIYNHAEFLSATDDFARPYIESLRATEQAIREVSPT